jgi:hypothetical protein
MKRLISLISTEGKSMEQIAKESWEAFQTYQTVSEEVKQEMSQEKAMKMENIKNDMEINSTNIHCMIKDIYENLVYMVNEFPQLDISKEALREISAIIKKYSQEIDFVKILSREIREDFAHGIRLVGEKENIRTKLLKINEVLHDQSNKLYGFISSIKDRECEIPFPASVLFYESGTNIDKLTDMILTASVSITENLGVYQHEIDFSDTTSNWV